MKQKEWLFSIPPPSFTAKQVYSRFCTHYDDMLLSL